MKEEKELNDGLKQLLDTLEEHGRNAKRQQQLSDLIDCLEASDTSLRGGTMKQSSLTAIETTQTELLCSARKDAKRRKLYTLWWTMGAAAACLLLWLLVKPTMKQTPEMKEETFVEKVETIDSIKAEENEVVIDDPIVREEPLAEKMPAVPQKTPTKLEKPRMKVVEEKPEEPILAEVIPTEPAKPTDNEKIESNAIPTENETPVVVQKPQRRVIRSLNLVCYECQKDAEHEVRPKPNVENRTLFGQPQDPNMKNGSLAFEFKLN